MRNMITNGPGHFIGHTGRKMTGTSGLQRWLLAGAAVALLQTASLQAQDKSDPAIQQPDQDFPFQTACIDLPPTNNTANKGIAIKLGNNAFMCFDPDLLRMAGGWTGKFLTYRGIVFDGGDGHPGIAGDEKFSTQPAPGVACNSGLFKDTRPEPFGPIPTTLGRWNGLYVHGSNVVLSYTVTGTKILEMPASAAANGLVGFVRNFKISKARTQFSIMLCDMNAAKGQVDGDSIVLSGTNNSVTVISLVGAPKGVALDLSGNGEVSLRVAAKTAASTFKVVLWNGAGADQSKASALLAGPAEVPDITKGGAAHWPEPVLTKGVVGANSTPDGAFTVDQLTPPVENPWKRKVRFGGFDFFSDGKRAACCTWDGDIWIVSGIDDKLDHLSWKRFASGLFEPLGLKIVNDVIYTSGRDQVTRYYDFDGDGEADFYENFNNQLSSSTGFHEFTFDLQTDSKGNFFLAKAGPVRGGGRGFGGDNYGTITKYAGTVMKLSKDGSKLEVYATGFRAPNGLAVGPHDEVTTSDNEGTWVPSTPINWITNGGFYGVENTAHLKTLPTFQQPMCWLSHQDFDNSGGEQIWVTSKKWGPFTGDLLHMSYGTCTLFLVMKETVNGQRQGGVVKIPVKFTSSSMRGRFNPVDGQLYIAGLQGWQTEAVKITGLDRVRYTGKPVHSVDGLHVTQTGVELHFTQPLDPASAADLENYSVKRWNYERAEHYGSPEFSVADPKKQGRDELPIQAAKLSPDGQTVVLQIADLKPVMQQSIQFDIKAKDGTTIKQVIQHTINQVP
ncbi:MAG: cytochrome c class [Pedosphaera sp.]|nr:cytochrome c class [Pedosphaera sp.]